MEPKFNNPTIDGLSAGEKKIISDPKVWGRSDWGSKKIEVDLPKPKVWGREDLTNAAAKEVTLNEAEDKKSLDDDFKYEGASEGFGGKEDNVSSINKAKQEDDFKYEGASEGFGGNKEDVVEKATEEEKARAKEIKNEMIGKSAETRKAEIKKLESEVDDERRAYLEADYKKNTALSRVRKFLTPNKYKGDEAYKNEFSMRDPELAQFRAYYDAKLMKLQELKIAEAKASGATDEQLADLYMNFRGEQKITMADEHDKLRADKLEGEKGGFIRKKMSSLVDSYNKLSTKKKLGIGLVMMAGGAAAAGIGGAAIGAMASVAAARRIFGGIVAGRGATLALEARGQKKDSEKLENDRQQILEQIKNLDPAAKYEFLTDKINNVVKDEENSIDKIKNQDIRQLATGAAVGVFIGSGMLGQLVSAGYHEAADYFKSLFGGGDPTSHMEAVKETIKGALGHIEVHSGGDSIEKSLIEYIKAHPELGIDNPGVAAHTMATDYAKASGIPFDKLNHIYPGTTFDVDPNTHQIVNMNAKFMPDHLPTAEPIAEPEKQFAPRNGSMPEQPSVAAEPEKQFAPRVGSFPEQPIIETEQTEIAEIDDNAEFEKGVDQDLNTAQVETQQEINKLENQYNELQEKAVEAHKITTETQGTFMSEANNTEVFDNMEAESNIRENISATNIKLHQLFEEKGILESPDTISNVKELRMNLFGGDSVAFKEASGLKMSDYIEDAKMRVSVGSFNGVSTISYEDADPALRGEMNMLDFAKLVPPQMGETVSHWTLRVAEEAQKATLKQN
jgi:hypothetical protein